MMLKWKLMATTLPIVTFAVGLKLFLERVVDYRGSVDFSDVSAVLTAGAFLIGFMLAGTMSDYKEAEKLPAEVACALEAIEDAMVVSSFRKDLDASAMRKQLFVVTEAIADWMARKKPVAAVYDALGGLNATFQDIDKAGGTTFANRASSEVHNLRKTVTRIDVIGQTGFLSSGYALLEVMITAIVALLMVSRFKSEVAEYTLVTFITLVYVYMLRLIRDIDDPFEYSPDGVRRGAAEVDIGPILNYRDRARARLG